MVPVGDGDHGVIAPCGRCRQVLLNQHPDSNVNIRTLGALIWCPHAN